MDASAAGLAEAEVIRGTLYALTRRLHCVFIEAPLCLHVSDLSMSQLPALIPREKPRSEAEGRPPIVRVQEIIFREAAALDASDIHIEPAQTHTRIRYRVDGVLK